MAALHSDHETYTHTEQAFREARARGEVGGAAQAGEQNFRTVSSACEIVITPVAQALDTQFRRVAGDQGRVDGADRDADDPVRSKPGRGGALVDTAVVRAERPTSISRAVTRISPPSI